MRRPLIELRPIDAPRLHQRIAEELTRLIDDAGLSAGQRLPSERELARSLKVSRSSLREAMSLLELEGRIEIRVGSGAYVRRPGARPPPPERRPDALSPFDVLKTRRLVEPEAAALAARHATAGDVHAMQRAFERLAADMRAGRMQSPADRDFHVAIGKASGNGALALVIARLWDESTDPLSVRIEELFVTRGRKRDNIGEHRAVLEAIAGRDAAGARRAMRIHLANAERQRMRMLRAAPPG